MNKRRAGMSGKWFSRQLQRLNQKALRYQVNPFVFILLYVVSFIPYYLGVYLMIRGSGLLSIDWRDLIHFKFSQIDSNNNLVLWGFLVNRLGWTLPYLYIEIKGRGLRWYVHLALVVWLLSSVGYALFQIVRG